ncbi:MAG: hypothetical protein LUC93_05690 [Planctomycetaceae bacterium]|nr:hypothetical protein [Planctomycetaceae bacterium]
MDTALAVEAIVPAAIYSGKTTENTEEEWGRVVWTDPRRERPTWAELEAAWIDVCTPTLADVKAARIDSTDARTVELILAGFDYQVSDVFYHFGYSLEDQGNFTKAALSAALAMIQGNVDYRQSWRGWTGGVPHTLSFTATEFVALATYAGKTHQENCLASGWAITERIRNAATVEEVESIVDDRQ